VDEDEVWRVKGSHALSRLALAVLRELWRWREQEAIAAGRPPFFVLSHEIMVDLAVAAADSQPVEPLVPRHLSDRRRSGLAAAVQTGLQLPAERWKSAATPVLRNSNLIPRLLPAVRRWRNLPEIGMPPLQPS
jgi:ribonuclease D